MSGEKRPALRRPGNAAQHVARVAFRLATAYPASDLGNPSDPLDDLIYLVLSGQTNEVKFQGAFGDLKRAFPRWMGLSRAPLDEIRGHISQAGLDHQKAVYIKGILRQVERDFGWPTLAPLSERTDGEIETYLKGLPGIGIKTARCVMLYAFDRDVFPADVHCLRVLNRLGTVDWQGERAELRADEAQANVPTALRRSLHVDLIQHGRAVCTASKPGCEQCVLRDLCLYSGEYAAAAKPTVVDLCCGAGGYSWGFMQAGFDVLLGVDVCQAALDTFAMNIPDAGTLKLDITGHDALEKIQGHLGSAAPTVVIAGTPCQGFSRAGRRNPDDERNSILRGAMRVAVRLRPNVIVFENVSNVRARAFAHHLRGAEGTLRRAGYRFRHAVLNAQSFGVAQARRRLILVGVRRDCAAGLRKALDELALRPLVEGATVAAVLDGLDPNCPNEKLGHDPMRHSGKVARKIAKIKPGGGPLSYRKLDPAKPAATLICGHRAMPCHYAVPRTITVREAARIQSFADDFRFLGCRGTRMQAVANAVPPKLAIGVAEMVRGLLGNPGHPAHTAAISAILSRAGIRPYGMDDISSSTTLPNGLSKPSGNAIFDDGVANPM